MNKPEKKDKWQSEEPNYEEDIKGFEDGEPWAYEIGYNQACDDWEAYHDGFIATLNHAVDNLPSEEEILKICKKCYIDWVPVAHYKEGYGLYDRVTKAIYKRIKEGK